MRFSWSGGCVALVVTVEVDADWGDPQNAAQHALAVAISGDQRGLHLPHDIHVNRGGDGDMDIDAQVVAVDTLATATYNGVIKLTTTQPRTEE